VWTPLVTPPSVTQIPFTGSEFTRPHISQKHSKLLRFTTNSSGADLVSYKVQGRVSNPSERGTGGRAPRRWGLGRLCPLPRIFCISYIKMMRSFCAFPVIFIDTVTFKKGHPNQKGGCPDTLDTAMDPPLLFPFALSWIISYLHHCLSYRTF